MSPLSFLDGNRIVHSTAERVCYSLPNPYPRFPTWITRRTGKSLFLFVLIPQFWLLSRLDYSKCYRCFPVMSVVERVKSLSSETKHQTVMVTGHEPRGLASRFWDSYRLLSASSHGLKIKVQCKMSAQASMHTNGRGACRQLSPQTQGSTDLTLLCRVSVFLCDVLFLWRIFVIRITSSCSSTGQ